MTLLVPQHLDDARALFDDPPHRPLEFFLRPTGTGNEELATWNLATGRPRQSRGQPDLLLDSVRRQPKRPVTLQDTWSRLQDPDPVQWAAHADVAQLVEHHLAKVRVAGSNPVVRSEVARSRGQAHQASSGGVAEWLRQGPAKPCTRVRFPPPPRTYRVQTLFRAISSVGERYLDTVEVTGSIPVSPTRRLRLLAPFGGFAVGRDVCPGGRPPGTPGSGGFAPRHPRPWRFASTAFFFCCGALLGCVALGCRGGG